MKIIDNLKKEDYINFFNKSKYNHFLQSYAWGEACKSRNQIPLYLGLVDDDNKIVAATMVLKKQTPLKMNYLYAPRGIIIDYDNKELLKTFTEELKKYLKETNSIYFKMDPGIIYQEINDDATPKENGSNNYELFNYLLSLGYKHQGFSKLFTKNQPRYTFRIDTTIPFEEIEEKMNKTFLKTVKRSYNYDLEITNQYDNKTFYDLMKTIAKRNNFNGYPEKFYDAFDKAFTKEKSVDYITIKIYPDKILKKSREDLSKIEKDIKSGKISDKKMVDTQNIIERIKKDIETFTPYENKYPEGYISLILICPKTNNAMWTLYIGNDELATYTFSVNRAYYEAIKLAYNQKLKFLDLFGVTGDPTTKESNYQRVYEYKRKIGGTYTEFIGEFDLVNKSFWYKVLPQLIKIYRKLKK